MLITEPFAGMVYSGGGLLQDRIGRDHLPRNQVLAGFLQLAQRCEGRAYLVGDECLLFPRREVTTLGIKTTGCRSVAFARVTCSASYSTIVVMIVLPECDSAIHIAGPCVT
jgi:hypothetical protein